MTSHDSALTGPALHGADRQRRGLERALIFGLVALVALGLFGLAQATGWAELRAQISRLGPAQIAALLALSLANYGLRALRWHGFARALGLKVTPGQSLVHFLGGFAFSVTPGRLGELVRMRWIGRETGWPAERTAPLALMDRAQDLAATAVILGLGLAFGWTGSALALPVVLLALLAAYVAVHPRLLHLAAGLGYRLTRRFARIFARLRRAARSLARFRRPGLVLGGLALGVIGWMAEAWAFHLLLTWLGADIALWRAVSIFVFAMIAGGLTGAPGGIGGAEAAMLALLSLEGVPLEIAIPATAIIRVTTLWFAIGLGLAVMPLAERRAARART